VLVHGDTTTTFAGALAAFYAKVSVGHVEAGLRTGDRWSPFPEEMNRSLVTRLSECHFCPTAQNAENLRREGVTQGVYVTGNTVIDAMGYTVRGEEFASHELSALSFAGRRVIALTCHRRENYGEPMENIFRPCGASPPGTRRAHRLPRPPVPTVRHAAGRPWGAWATSASSSLWTPWICTG
jgi:UDP-N-acetylglucosamine 2-epimerase